MGCSLVPKMSYAQFTERVYPHIGTTRNPFSGSIELTFRCNLRCVHCYCNVPANDSYAVQKELKTDEIYRILDEVEEAGCFWLLLTGGEVLLREDFLDIYTYAKKKGFIITLFTNGTLLTPEIADYLTEWPPFSVEITLYGATKNTYERITRVPGSFDRCKRGIELLLERHIPLALKTMVTTLNCHELPKIKEYAEGLGVRFRFDPLLNPRLDGSKEPCRYRLSPHEVLKLDRADEKRAKEWQDFCQTAIQPFESDRLFICGAGVSTFHIDPFGQMSPCEMVRFQSFDLRWGTFREGWQSFVSDFLTLRTTKDYPCSRCELISVCGQCPGWAWLENGRLRDPVEYLCQIAHLRADAFHKDRL
jgi:radical SAM protein with 4Fe4S-binding SPASM domain